MEPDRVLAQLGWRLRTRGAAITLLACALFAEGFVTAWPDQGAPQMAVALYVAAYGLFTMLRPPIYLRKPEDIVALACENAGLAITMASGAKRFRRMDPISANQLRRALEQVGAARRLTARVVRR